MADLVKMMFGLNDENDPMTKLVNQLPSSSDIVQKFTGGTKEPEYSDYSDYYDSYDYDYDYRPNKKGNKNKGKDRKMEKAKKPVQVWGIF